MATPFLSSEEYDERAHRLYDQGEYEAALSTLKDGLRLYPHSVDLHVGLGYTRLARDEYVWAKQAFQHALVLDPEHDEALVGMGEALLRFGQRAEARRLFMRVREAGSGDDLDLLLSMGRALYREQLFGEAYEVFAEAASEHGKSAEAAAAVGYALHRLGDEEGARRELKRALDLDPAHHEARVYFGHMMYDRGDWAGALRELERVPVGEHWDSLAVSRLVELKRALQGLELGAPELSGLEARLGELDQETDPVDELLAEIEEAVATRFAAARSSPEPGPPHCVQLPQGSVCTGSWYDIVRQIRDVTGVPGESVAQFMRRRADEERSRSGSRFPTEDPREFLVAGARAGYWHIEY
ncbi:MAG: tetratricopeptide repeat protein [Longimicrobiales bacterium]